MKRDKVYDANRRRRNPRGDRARSSVDYETPGRTRRANFGSITNFFKIYFNTQSQGRSIGSSDVRVYGYTIILLKRICVR